MDEVLARLGIEGPVAVDVDGLTDLYRRWSRSVPFDNIRKLIALRSGDDSPLPGMDPDDFFAHWLEHGVGGTCWPTTSALTALLQWCGFDARMVAASMFDMGEPTHGTTIVTLDGSEWLVDSSLLTEQPVPLGDEVTAIDHPVYRTTATPVEEGWLFAFPFIVADAVLPCRTISPDAVTHDFCVERYEVSRTFSPFNDQVHARRNDETGTTTFTQGMRYRRTADGLDDTEATGGGLAIALADEFGLSEELVARLGLRVEP
jgi:arylamine N-acetyltransferase